MKDNNRQTNDKHSVKLDRCFTEIDREEWDALLGESNSSSVFLTHGWLKSWEASYGKGADLIVLRAYVSSKLVAAVAFENRSGLVIFAGQGPSDYSDFIFLDTLEKCTAARIMNDFLDIVCRTAKRFKHFKLGRIQVESNSFELFDHFECKYFASTSETGVAPRMSMEVVEKSLRKKSLVRHERKLAKQGTLISHIYSSTVDISPLLDSFFTQHIERWENTEFPSLFLQEEACDFYRQLVLQLEDSQCIRFMVLYLDEVPMAMHFGFVHSGRYTWYKPTFNPVYSKMSPGEVLLKRLLESARTEAVGTFDFTIGNEAFKRRFATELPMVTHTLLTNSRFLALMIKARQNLKSGWQWLLEYRNS